MSGEMASNVWRFAENGLQGLELFAKHGSKVWRNGENGLQRLEVEKLKSSEVEKFQPPFNFSTFHPFYFSTGEAGENGLQRLEVAAGGWH